MMTKRSDQLSALQMVTRMSGSWGRSPVLGLSRGRGLPRGLPAAEGTGRDPRSFPRARNLRASGTWPFAFPHIHITDCYCLAKKQVSVP